MSFLHGTYECPVVDGKVELPDRLAGMADVLYYGEVSAGEVKGYAFAETPACLDSVTDSPLEKVQHCNGYLELPEPLCSEIGDSVIIIGVFDYFELYLHDLPDGVLRPSLLTKDNISTLSARSIEDAMALMGLISKSNQNKKMRCQLNNYLC